MTWTRIPNEQLTPYFFDTFKSHKEFYPVVEYNDDAIRLIAKIDGKTHTFRHKLLFLPLNIVIPIIVTRWKKKYLSTLYDITETMVDDLFIFNEKICEIHSKIKDQIRKFNDPIIVLKTFYHIVNAEMKSFYETEGTLFSYSVSKPKYSTDSKLNISCNINFILGKGTKVFEDTRQIFIILE